MIVITLVEGTGDLKKVTLSTVPRTVRGHHCRRIKSIAMPSDFDSILEKDEVAK